MAGGDRLFKPNAGVVRDPVSNEKQHGRIVNPPRFPVLGGFSGKAKGFFKNMMTIGKPGNEK